MNREFDFSRIFTLGEADFCNQIGEKFGVKLTVLAKEGKPYQHVDHDWATGKNHVYQGEVPVGSVYAQVSAKSLNSLQDFYKRLEEILKQQTNQQK